MEKVKLPRKLRRVNEIQSGKGMSDVYAEKDGNYCGGIFILLLAGSLDKMYIACKKAINRHGGRKKTSCGVYDRKSS